MPVNVVPTPNAPAVAGPYSPAVRAGDWLVLAGQVGLDPATGALVV
ncbi:MAG: Rid family hydrolase, partial [Acidimicrobiia bacterium]